MAWYYPLKESIPFMCEMPLREARALDNMQRAVDMFEVFERVCIRNSKSFMPHAAVFKMTQDILTVGDIWALDLSSLELLNAETKRVAESSGARRIEISSSDSQQRKPLRNGAAGPANLVTAKPMSTTMSLSVLKHMLMQSQLRRGDGLYSVPDSRRTERLLNTGRTKHLSTGIKLEKLGVDDSYDPRSDTCVKAFVRMLAARAVEMVYAAGPSS